MSVGDPNDQESLLPKSGSGQAGRSYGKYVALCCSGCALIPALVFLWLALSAAVFPVPEPSFNVFNVTDASDLVQNMPFPKTGPMPGIWWMDQYGNHLDAVPSDYPYYFPYASPEILFTLHGAKIADFGNGLDCYYPVGGGGFSENATWTYVNTNGQGMNYFWSILNPVAAEANYTGMPFCQVNESLIMFQNDSGGIYTIEKTDWGWSRSNVFPAAKADPASANFRAWLYSWIWPPVWGTSDVDYSRTYHYPVFQVIDADGKPTEHFQPFLKFINTAVPCKKSWLSWLGRASVQMRPYLFGKANYCNEGPGTLLWPPLMPTPPGPPCRPFCDVNATGGAGDNASAAAA